MSFDRELTKLGNKVQSQTEKVNRTKEVIEALTAAGMAVSLVKPWQTKLERQLAALDATKQTIEVLHKIGTSPKSKK